MRMGMDTISDNTAGQKPRDALQNELEYQRQVRNKSGAAGLEWAIAEIDRLTAENAKLVQRVHQLTQTRIELSESQARLRAALERYADVIAEWANTEGISFDATARLSKALANEQDK